MGSYDGAEVCELVGLYLLSCLQHLNVILGVYRDDALGVHAMTPKEGEDMKKEICKIFKDHQLSIDAKVNTKSVDFLDINLDLETELYKPFKKADNTPLYVNIASNHPPTIIKNIPGAVNRRLTNISANGDVFKDETSDYQEALNQAGYTHQLKYDPPTTSNSTKRNRSRKITWFNPPWSQNVSTNVGAEFLKLIDECFPPSNPLSKILNRNTVKVSYRCMPNMGLILSRHNSKVMQEDRVPTQPQPTGCNCRRGPASCPVNGACLTEGVVYRAKVLQEDTNIEEFYTGMTARSFKQRLYEHRTDFNNRSRKGTRLSKHVWSLKSQKIPYTVSWKILAKAPSFNPATKTCKLCLKEKWFIMFRPEGATLNHRSEFFSTCRHRLKPLLAYT